MEVAVYRLVQEAFSNVYKHAHATYVTLELVFQQQMIKITVTDNGVGFHVNKILTKIEQGTTHYGLIGMKERLKLLEGRLDMESSKGIGTKLSMIIPISNQQKEE
jgi:two-component system sensor histidine kinase DegS